MSKLFYIIKKLIPIKLFKFVQPAYHFLLAWFSGFIYGSPSNELIVIGITGTTGKTTTVCLVAEMLKKAGYKTGFTSTAIFNDGKKEWLNDKKMTMIGRFFTQKILRNMVKNNCKYAIIETTSEGIRQFRHKFINYDILIFTGLYPEHIESHGNFENYKKAKGQLFEHLHSCDIKYIDKNQKITKLLSPLQKTEAKRIKKTIIANGDDEHFDYFTNFWADQKFIFTTKNDLEIKKTNETKIIKYNNIKISKDGVSFNTCQNIINLKILGEFNTTNAMASLCVGLSQEFDIKKIIQGLESIKGIPGRLEKINQGQNFTVIVDYAFEPNAVYKLYEIIKLIPHQNIIHVLGATGGGRDTAKRPKLGELAGRNADYVIITNEDPYDEDPEIIISQVAFGAEKVNKKKNINLFKILDRKKAIKKAISLANKNDIVLITGKGSEQAICIANDKKIIWDDRKIVKEILLDYHLSVDK